MDGCTRIHVCICSRAAEGLAQLNTRTMRAREKERDMKITRENLRYTSWLLLALVVAGGLLWLFQRHDTVVMFVMLTCVMMCLPFTLAVLFVKGDS